MHTRAQREISQLNIRRIVPEDAENIIDLYKQAGHALSMEQIQTRLKLLLPLPDHAFYLAELPNGDLIGWAHVYIGMSLNIDPVAYVRAILIARELRLAGAEQALIHIIELWAREQGCSALYLWPEGFQQEEVELYQRLGYMSQAEPVLQKLLVTPDIRTLH